MLRVEQHIIWVVIATAAIVVVSFCLAGYTFIHQGAVVAEAAAKAEKTLCQNVNTARVQSNVGLRNVVRQLAVRTGNADLAAKVGVAPTVSCAS